LDLAVEEAVAGALNSKSAGWEPELAIVFLSSAYVREYDQLVELLRQKVPSLKHVFGSTVGATVMMPMISQWTSVFKSPTISPTDTTFGFLQGFLQCILQTAA
jgi:small ligand-binding sensory domain FIST